MSSLQKISSLRSKKFSNIVYEPIIVRNLFLFLRLFWDPLPTPEIWSYKDLSLSETTWSSLNLKSLLGPVEASHSCRSHCYKFIFRVMALVLHPLILKGFVQFKASVWEQQRLQSDCYDSIYWVSAILIFLIPLSSPLEFLWIPC